MPLGVIVGCRVLFLVGSAGFTPFSAASAVASTIGALTDWNLLGACACKGIGLLVADHRHRVGQRLASPLARLLASDRFRPRGRLARIRVIAAPRASHPAKTASSPQLTTA